MTLTKIYEYFIEYKNALYSMLSKMEEDNTVSDSAFYEFDKAINNAIYAFEHAFSYDNADIYDLTEILNEMYDLLTR